MQSIPRVLSKEDFTEKYLSLNLIEFYQDCKLDKNGNYLKPMEVVTNNLKKLIIIDDCKHVYN